MPIITCSTHIQTMVHISLHVTQYFFCNWGFSEPDYSFKMRQNLNVPSKVLNFLTEKFTRSKIRASWMPCYIRQRQWCCQLCHLRLAATRTMTLLKQWNFFADPVSKNCLNQKIMLFLWDTDIFNLRCT